MIAPIAALFGLLRGIKEGMTMQPGGVREHRWFKWYHALSGLLFWSFAALALKWEKARPGWIGIAGALFLLWEFTEIGYLLARPELGAYEHVAFFDIVSITLHGSAVYAIHGVRITAGIALSIVGYFKEDTMKRNLMAWIIGMVMLFAFAVTAFAAEVGTPAAEAIGNMFTDTILPALIILIGTLVGLAVRKLTEKLGIEKNEAWERWASAQAEAAVQYAGEMAAAKLKTTNIKMGGNDKLNLAVASLVSKVPKLTREQAEVFVHAALARIIGEGATGDKTLVSPVS